jgi:hypothetical protein
MREVLFVSYVNNIEFKINGTNLICTHQNATKTGVCSFHHVIICYSPTDVFVAPVTVIKATIAPNRKEKSLIAKRDLIRDLPVTGNRSHGPARL